MVTKEPSGFNSRLKTLSTIDVAWGVFTVEVTSKDLINDGESCWGEVDFNNCKLRLSKNTPPAMQKLTFLHELMHIVLETIGYGLDTEKDGMLSISTNNEDLTELLTKGMLILFNKNPKLKEILFDD